MERDDLTSEEADEIISEGKSEIYEMLEEGDICDIEDVFADIFGLEPDYIFDIL